MNQTVIEDVSEILSTFPLDEISDLLRRQVNLLDADNPMHMTDYFKPLYYRYRSILETPDNSEEIKTEARNQFNDICNLFINLICEEFHLEMDSNWIIDNEGSLPGLVTAMYGFFISDLTSNLHEVCINYINKNKKEIFQVFEERKNKKDAATLVNKKNHTIEMAVIIANIYDVSTWILSQITEEQYMQYLNPDYAPLKIIQKFFEDGIIAGEFMETINEVYTENQSLKAEVCYQIISTIERKIQGGNH
jgi:hypothetical protein